MYLVSGLLSNKSVINANNTIIKMSAGNKELISKNIGNLDAQTIYPFDFYILKSDVDFKDKQYNINCEIATDTEESLKDNNVSSFIIEKSSMKSSDEVYVYSTTEFEIEDTGDIATVKFSPEESGTYSIYSSSDKDTYVTLYDSDENYL